jgi:RNA polymerase sigma factor (sigma-70 family)
MLDPDYGLLPSYYFPCNTTDFALCIKKEATMTPTPTTRASLLLRLRDSQDHEAWMEFVSLYEPVVYRLLRQRGLQDVDARDVMQELFLSVSRNINRWDPAKARGSFRGWLRRVVRNLVINWLKNPQRRMVAVGGEEVCAMLDFIRADSEEETLRFDRELRRALLHRAGQQVQSEVQPATWQAFWETSVAVLSPAEAAAKLGMTVGAVRVAKCRVLARLQAAVAEMEKAL